MRFSFRAKVGLQDVGRGLVLGLGLGYGMGVKVGVNIRIRDGGWVGLRDDGRGRISG